MEEQKILRLIMLSNYYVYFTKNVNDSVKSQDTRAVHERWIRHMTDEGLTGVKFAPQALVGLICSSNFGILFFYFVRNCALLIVCSNGRHYIGDYYNIIIII